MRHFVFLNLHDNIGNYSVVILLVILVILLVMYIVQGTLKFQVQAFQVKQ